MDFERRLYEALKHHKKKHQASKPNLFKQPPIGSIMETDFGPIWMVETVYNDGYLHGRVELSKQIPETACRYFDTNGNIKSKDITHAAVIDTETTGLAGGTGTYPFITGIGFWNENKFIVRQYILRDFCEEPAQLLAFSNDLKNTTSLLTYNGKSFDIPLLKTRFRINRMKEPFAALPHIDLLHPCRRIYKNHFQSFKLSKLEAMIVGFERSEDVPSHLIPKIYFDFLQNRNDDLLLPILNHNRDDIVSLYILAQETARRIDLALSGASNDDNLYLSLARHKFSIKQYENTLSMLKFINPKFASAEINDEARMLSALSCKRLRNWENAWAIWNEMLKSNRFGIYPHVELAKHLEHRVKDFDSALELTLTAIRATELEREFITGIEFKIRLKALKRRQRRLLSRIKKAPADN